MESPLPERLSPLVECLRAPNAGPLTLTGTNTYLVGQGAGRVVIDPGPLIESHLQTLLAHVKEQAATIELILVTHGHPDHYPGAARLQELTGAPVAAYQDAPFAHDINLADGAIIEKGGIQLQAIFTPGHAPDHLCYFLTEEAGLFSGDHILGTSTTVIAPPRGDMSDYLASLELLLQHWSQARTIYPGHGPVINDPTAKVQEYLQHRRLRQQQVVDALHQSAKTVPQLVEQIYQNVDHRLWPAAARQVLAYLIMLERQDQVRAVEVPAEQTTSFTSLWYRSDQASVDPVAAAELGLHEIENEPLRLYVLTTGSL